MAIAETITIPTASDLPTFAWSTWTFPSTRVPITRGTSAIFPTVIALAVAYAAKPLANNKRNDAVKLGNNRGTPMVLQNFLGVAPRFFAASRHSF